MKKALTISELLITMGIIGLIAILVLPGFLKDYHQKLYANQLKKVINTFETAINQACVDNNVSYFYQTPYINNNAMFLLSYLEGKNTGTLFAGQYKTLNNNEANDFTLPAAAVKIKLKSGEVVSMNCADDDCTFFVDVNSTDLPNVGGRDFFTIHFNPKTNEFYDISDSANCGTTYDGAGCFKYMLEHNWESKPKD